MGAGSTKKSPPFRVDFPLAPMDTAGAAGSNAAGSQPRASMIAQRLVLVKGQFGEMIIAPYSIRQNERLRTALRSKGQRKQL